MNIHTHQKSIADLLQEGTRVSAGKSAKTKKYVIQGCISFQELKCMIYLNSGKPTVMVVCMIESYTNTKFAIVLSHQSSFYGI